jgi:hypothetical protein
MGVAFFSCILGHGALYFRFAQTLRIFATANPSTFIFVSCNVFEKQFLNFFHFPLAKLEKMWYTCALYTRFTYLVATAQPWIVPKFPHGGFSYGLSG